LKGGLVEELEELEKNDNRGGDEKGKTNDGKNIFFLSERQEKKIVRKKFSPGPEGGKRGE